MRKSLMTKLVASTGLLVLIIVVIISVISIKISSDAIEYEVEENLMGQLESTIKILEEQKSNTEATLGIIADLPAFKNLTSSRFTTQETQNMSIYLEAFRKSNENMLDAIFIADSKGKILVDSEGNKYKGIELTDKSYFDCVEKGEPTWSDIVLSQGTNLPVRVYVMPMINKKDQTLGYIATIVKVDSLVKVLLDVKIGELGYAYMVDQNGFVVVHPNADIAMKKNVSEFGISELEAALPDMASGNMNKVKYSYNGDTKLNLYGGFDQYSVSINAVESEYLAPVVKMQRSIILVGVVMLIIGLIASFIISRYIITRIRKMKTVMLAASEGDLTVCLEDINEDGDEIHQISGALNFMIKRFNEIVTEIVKSSETLSSSSQQMASSAEEGGKSANDVTLAIQQISQGIELQANDVNNTRLLVDDMKSKLDGSVDETYKMAKESEIVMETATNSHKMITETVEKMVEIKTSSEKTIAVINKLNEQSDKINRISDTISDIANQTNLLALNAAIEAARAGEAGKGFAVVADEIRKLATDSQTSASGINNLILEIQAEIQEANNFTQAESEAIDSGVRAIDVTGKAFAEILALIENTQESIKVVVTHITSTQKLGDSVTKSVENMAEIMTSSSASAQEVSASTEEQTAVSEEIAAASDHLSQLATELFEHVSQYKI